MPFQDSAVQIVFSDVVADSLLEGKITTWVNHILQHEQAMEAGVSICFCDAPTMQFYNAQYRYKDSVTDVLSFPYSAEDRARCQQSGESELWGDILICLSVVQQAADDLGVSFEQHLIHVVTHGVLHLIGYDHIDAKEARKMERSESTILQAMGFPNPWKEMI